MLRVFGNIEKIVYYSVKVFDLDWYILNSIFLLVLVRKTKLVS